MDHQKVNSMTVSCMTITIIIFTAGATVILYPPGIVPVCNGDELELTCTIRSGRVLEWSITLMLPEDMTLKHVVDSVTQMFPMHTITVDGSVMFTFSRISSPNTQPLISQLLISPATSIVNGTEVVCVDRETHNSSSTRVYIFNQCRSIK